MIIFKRKIKEEYKKYIIKKIKFKMLVMASILTVFMLVILLLNTFINFTTALASMSNNIISVLSENIEVEEETEEHYWLWESVDEAVGNLTGSGGLMPKDRRIMLRAELIEILYKSVEDAAAVTGNRLEPAWVIGTVFRETGNSMFVNMNESMTQSLFTDLLLFNPVCGRGSNCMYINNGVSHFYGGTVSGRIDRGDPYRQVINTNIELYNRFGPDHAAGYMQFEIPYVYGSLNRLYENPSVVVTSNEQSTVVREVTMDDNLGFIRPNILFIPDVMYSGTFRLARTPTIRNSNYTQIINSPDFLSLSEYNQNFIKFMYKSAGYGRGHITDSDDEMALALIELAKSGRINKLDEMLIPVSNTYWNRSTMTVRGSKRRFIEDVKQRFAINIPADRVAWYGVYSANIGKLAYVEMLKIIEQAEKDNITREVGNAGNWVGNPGSGRFGNNGSIFFLESIGIRWFHQTSRVTTHSSTWGNLRIAGTTRIVTPFPRGNGIYNATMASGGCGIYTIAMIASNLKNKDITPDVALAALGGRHQFSALADSGVPYLSSKLGLRTKKLTYTRPDFRQNVVNELAKGNMILFISRAEDGGFPWYQGRGHFMAIRGITEDGKYLGITSVGNSNRRLTAEQIMQIPLEHEVFMRYLSPNRNYVWVIGLNVD